MQEAELYNIDELTHEVKRKASLLEKTFEDFSLDVKVVDIEMPRALQTLAITSWLV